MFWSPGAFWQQMEFPLSRFKMAQTVFLRSLLTVVLRQSYPASRFFAAALPNCVPADFGAGAGVVFFEVFVLWGYLVGGCR